MYVDFIEPCFGIGHNLSLICQMTSEDIKHQLIIIIIIWTYSNTELERPETEFRSCVKVDVAVLGSRP